MSPCNYLIIMNNNSTNGNLIFFKGKLCLFQSLLHKILVGKHRLYHNTYTSFLGTKASPKSCNCSALIFEGESIIRSRPTLFFGNAITSRILCDSVNKVINLSSPNAIPPCGGAPYLKAFNKKPNCF